MMFILLLKLTAVVLSVALSAGMLARDHGLAANRLISAFFLCNAWWASCEFLLFQTTDPVLATQILRWTTLGWVPLGALCMHGSLCLSSMRDHPVARATPFFYAAIVVTVPLGIGTDRIIESAVSGTVGWQAEFGSGFGLAYAAMAFPLLSILSCWRRLMTLPGHPGQNALARIVFLGVSGSMIMGTVTAVILPLLGIAAVGITTTLLSLVGVAAAWTLNRYGYSLISPEAYAREIFETLDDGVVVIGEGGRVRDVNAAFARLVGRAETEILGRTIRSLLPGFPDRPKEMGEATFLLLKAEDGSSVPVVLSAPVSVSVGKRVHGDAFVVRDRREVVSLQRQLAVSGRLAAVGDLSKSISESIRQPAADTRSQLCELGREWREMQDGLVDETNREAASEGLELIDECIGGIDRVTSIVDEVGRFSTESRQGTLACEDLSEVVEGALRIAKVQAKAYVQIEARFDPDVRVMCYRPELERVVTNLLVNAFHALEQVREDAETRSTGSGTETGQAGSAHLAVAVCAQGGRALIHVEDNGCGIASDVLDRVFDPFFTTKPVGKGTGLGLAISYHILRKHGGEIRISSIEDSGTSVAVELPRHDVD